MRKGSPMAQPAAEDGRDPGQLSAEDAPGGAAGRFFARCANIGREDCLAGLTVGVMAIPQSMAYAMLANLPAIYGLYTALIPPLVYALLGGSKQLHVGPVSMVSLLTANAIQAAGVTDPTKKAAVATLVALLAGAMQVAVGFARLGGLVNFATLPIISGFTAGASVVVIVTQVQHIFGITVASGQTTFHTLFNTILALQNGLNVYSFGLGLFFLGSLWFAKHQATVYPKIAALKAAGPLFIVVFGTAVTSFFQLQRHGVKIIGSVPDGLPKLTDWGAVSGCAGETLLESVQVLLPFASAVAFISFMESIAVAKTLAVHHGYEVEAGKELTALGASNMAGSFFNAYAGAGAFSRSAVASGSGAKTQAAAMVASVVVGVTLLFLTPLFHFLPKGVLSAIVVHAVWGLIKVSDLRRLLKLSYRDSGLWIVAFTGTLFSVTVGLLLAVACSVALVIWDTSKPVVERMGQLRDGSFVAVGATQDAVVDASVVVFAIRGTLHGACAQSVKQQIGAIDAEERRRRGESRPFNIAVDMSGVTALDTTVMSALRDSIRAMAKAAGEYRCVTAYCGMRPDLRQMLEGSFDVDTPVDKDGPADLSPVIFMLTVSEAVKHFSDSQMEV